MSSTHRGPVAEPAAGLASVVERNIEALVGRRKEEERARSARDRVADRVTAFTGSLWSVVAHAALVGVWIVVNLGWLPIRPFDPTFVILATIASVEAIFLTTFVLISQNRMQAQADVRADLDLQVSLLAEHEVTRLITLVGAIADRLGIEEAANPELEELGHDVAPERVLDQIKQTERTIEARPPRGSRTT